MARRRIPTARVRHWLLRGVLVGGAVGAALVLGGPAQAAEATPPGPVTGLLGGLTTAVDDVSGAALDLATGTVDQVVPVVQDAPVVRDVAVVAELPVTVAVDDVAKETTGAVRAVTATVDQVLVPVARPVDAVVVEVARPAVEVVDAVPLPDEGVALPAPTGAATTVSDVVVASSAVFQNASGATISASLAGTPAGSIPAAAAGSPGSSGHVPAGPRPAPDTVPGSGTVSGSTGLVGPDLVARGSGRAALSTDLGGVRPLAADDALAASGAPAPPFSPD